MTTSTDTNVPMDASSNIHTPTKLVHHLVPRMRDHACDSDFGRSGIHLYAMLLRCGCD